MSILELEGWLKDVEDDIYKLNKLKAYLESEIKQKKDMECGYV